MENITGVLDLAVFNANNSGELIPNVTEAGQSVLSDDLYWAKVLPKLRTVYIEDTYGEHYKLIFYVTLVLCIIGYVTNMFNVVVLSGIPMSYSMNLFLLVLSVADVCHITTQFSHVVHYLSGFQLFPGYGWVIFYLVNTYFETLFLYATNWMAVAIGAWRFAAITWPLHSRNWCSKGRAQKVIVTIFVLSALLASPVFVVITSEHYDYRSRTLYDKTISEFAKADNSAFLKAYWVMLLFMGFVPSLLLGILTFGLFKNLYDARAKHRGIVATSQSQSFVANHMTTIMLTVILILYILSNFPDGCQYLVSVITNGNIKAESTVRIYTDFIRIFMLSNNSLGFFIYYGLGEGFRTRFNKVFCGCLCNRKKSSSREDSEKTTASEINRSRVSLNSVSDKPEGNESVV